MTTTDTPMRNGVDTAALFATLDAVKASPDIAKFQFRATNRWISGTHNRSTIHGFYGAGLACRTCGRQRDPPRSRPRCRTRRPRRRDRSPAAGVGRVFLGAPCPGRGLCPRPRWRLVSRVPADRRPGHGSARVRG